MVKRGTWGTGAIILGDTYIIYYGIMNEYRQCFVDTTYLCIKIGCKASAEATIASNQILQFPTSLKHRPFRNIFSLHSLELVIDELSIAPRPSGAEQSCSFGFKLSQLTCLSDVNYTLHEQLSFDKECHKPPRNN